MTTMTTSPVSPPVAREPSQQPSGQPGDATRGSSLTDRYRQASPIYQWAIAITAGVVLWLFAEDFLWSTAARWNEENKRMQSALEEGAARADLLEGVRESIAPVGRIVVPRTEGDGSEELSNAVIKVLAANKVTDGFEFQKRTSGNNAPSAELVQLVGEGAKLGKVSGELRFNASQETVIKVIAGLEAEEMIESISRLKLARASKSSSTAKDQKIGVTLTVEAWVRLDRKTRGVR